MTTTTVNDALVQLDNVVTATNYLLEELQTRKNQFLDKENILENVKTEMQSSWFHEELMHYIRNNYEQRLAHEVAFYVMNKIDSDIEAFINDRVNKALEAAGVHSQNV